MTLALPGHHRQRNNQTVIFDRIKEARSMHRSRGIRCSRKRPQSGLDRSKPDERLDSSTLRIPATQRSREAQNDSFVPSRSSKSLLAEAMFNPKDVVH